MTEYRAEESPPSFLSFFQSSHSPSWPALFGHVTATRAEEEREWRKDGHIAPFFSSFHPLRKESCGLMRGEVRGKPGLSGRSHCRIVVELSRESGYNSAAKCFISTHPVEVSEGFNCSCCRACYKRGSLPGQKRNSVKTASTCK